MTSYPSLQRLLAAALTAFVIGAPIAYWASRDRGNQAAAQPAKDGDWIMYGGSPSRNLANLVAKGLPAEWDIEKNTNIKWVASLGSKAYGGPVVSGGRVF